MTLLEQYTDLLKRAYVAMDPDLGSNDDEHDILHECIEIIEGEVRAMGGELPPRPGDEEDESP